MTGRSSTSRFSSQRSSTLAPSTSATPWPSEHDWRLSSMRYLLLVRTNVDDAVAGGPDERLAEEMGRLLEDMTKAGVLLDTGGLRPVGEATYVRLVGGRQTVIDGPVTGSKEVVGGYCLVQ